MNQLYPVCILILLIAMTGGIVSFYYEPRKPIIGYKEHVPVTMLSSDMFVKDIAYCRDCGETDLTGNCFTKLFFTNCDVRVRLSDSMTHSELYCHNHFKPTKNAYQCHCQFPAGVVLNKRSYPGLIQ